MKPLVLLALLMISSCGIDTMPQIRQRQREFREHLGSLYCPHEYPHCVYTDRAGIAHNVSCSQYGCHIDD
jgi:hypothetical protein